jgi:hypothetical protein
MLRHEGDQLSIREFELSSTLIPTPVALLQHRRHVHRRHMKAIQGYHLIKPENVSWRPSNLMQIPNADYLERTGSENIGARLWRLPPKSAVTLHKHKQIEITSHEEH